MTHNQDWIGYLPDIYFKSAEAIKTWKITKEEFADNIRHSATTPYRMEMPPAWRKVSLEKWQEGMKNSPLLAEKIDDYYISKYHFGDHPNAHKENLSDPLKVRQLKKNKWLNDDGTLKDIEYKTNKQGFRDRHFDDEPGIACFGDSFTFGVGLNQEQTWVYQLGKMLGTKTWNLGTPGLSLDVAVYYAQNFMDEDLPNVSGICVFEPTYGVSNKVMRRSNPDRLLFQPWHKLYYTHDIPEDLQEPLMNSMLHTALFQQEIMIKSLESIAKIKGIPFVKVSMTNIKPVDFSRDLMHRGPESMKLVATAMYDKYIHESS